MANLINLTGREFGRWTVICRAANKGRMSAWLCRCACGYEVVVQGGNLREGKSTSCLRCSNATHGHARTKSHSSEYLCWRNMRARCEKPNWPTYRHYGGRGITVCDRWRDDFAAFLADMGPKPSADLTLERVDNDVGYQPDNCVWATRSQQNRNRRYLGRRSRHAEAEAAHA